MALEPIYKVADIRKRYGCADSTARKYMRQMEHTEKPLTVTESAIREWDASRTVPSEKEIRKAKARKRQRPYFDRHIVPRTRG